ncbi:MAG: hypothetical protein ACJ78Q_07320 [Chloroflexia bacterium]
MSERRPVQGQGQAKQEEFAAWRAAPARLRGEVTASSPYTNPWQLQATLSGAVIKDISFPTAQVGYAAAELGQVWKTTDGGSHWARIMNLGFPYYWYGVQALDASNVVISGFINNNMSGVARWSQDGGATWSPDVVLTTRGWSYRVRFADALHGLVLDGLNYDGPNAAHYTTNGGRTAADWTPVVPDPNGGWFGNQFSLLPDLKARAAGITYCTSLNPGAAWNCRPSIDSVFDGPVFFADDQHGWVGGGSISPAVEGCVHRTTDAGATWSGRTLDNPWPIRELRFLNDQTGWAAGGNIYSQVGGMYFSSDGGQTWSPDATTGAEMDACDSVATEYGPQVWCAGYTSAFNGVVYTLLPAGGTPTPTATVVGTNTATATPTFRADTATATATAHANTATSTATAAATPFCARAWRGSTTANPGANDNALYGVASISTGEAWAVGMADNRALVEHWNGAEWSVATVPTVTGRLKGVAAAASNDVWAVGYALTDSLIMHWDGSAWSRVPGPHPGAEVNVLDGVAVVAANDVWAVGYTGTALNPGTFIIHWDGTQWSMVSSPSPDPYANVLLGVSAVSASDVWAVGYTGGGGENHPLTLHWNGTAWNVMPAPYDGWADYLYGVTAVSANDVWAVGYVFQDILRRTITLTLHWDGTSWSLVTSPNPGSAVHGASVLYGVSAAAANDVWALGYYSGVPGTDQQYALVLHWDGLQWNQVPDPAPNVAGNTLFGIDAHQGNDIWAAGYRGPTANGRLSQALHAPGTP